MRRERSGRVGVYRILSSLARLADVTHSPRARAELIAQFTTRICGSFALGVPNRLRFRAVTFRKSQAFLFHLDVQCARLRRTKWKSNMQIYAATTNLSININSPFLILFGTFSERGRRAFNYIRLDQRRAGVEWSASQCALEAIRKCVNVCDGTNNKHLLFDDF